MLSEDPLMSTLSSLDRYATRDIVKDHLSKQEKNL